MSITATVYPYISASPDIAGGVPIVSGTRVTVRRIAGYYQMGMNVDEILSALSYLRPSQVHSALAYYFRSSRRNRKGFRECLRS